MLHDTLCVSGVGFLYFYCLQDNVKDQQAKQEETTWMAYRRIHGSCSPLVQDTLTIFISEHCNLEPNFLLVYFSYYFSCSFPWPPSSMAPFFPIVCHPALSPHLRAYIKSVVAFCKKPGNEKLVKLLGRVLKSVWGMYVDMCLVLFLEISDYEILWTKHALNTKTTLRKDRYNRKIEKFYVVVEEGDEELSDLEEVETHHERQAWISCSCLQITPLSSTL